MCTSCGRGSDSMHVFLSMVLCLELQGRVGFKARLRLEVRPRYGSHAEGFMCTGQEQGLTGGDCGLHALMCCMIWCQSSGGGYLETLSLTLFGWQRRGGLQSSYT